MEKFDLAPAEWNIMECLWERAPQTGRELTEQLEASMGWSRSTTLTLLRRMVGKGVVTCDTEGTKNTFSPAVRREDAALAETETFLDRVYQGSLSMMVSAMTGLNWGSMKKAARPATPKAHSTAMMVSSRACGRRPSKTMKNGSIHSSITSRAVI